MTTKSYKKVYTKEEIIEIVQKHREATNAAIARHVMLRDNEAPEEWEVEATYKFKHNILAIMEQLIENKVLDYLDKME